MNEKNILREKPLAYFQHLPAVWLLFVGLILTAGAAAKTMDWERRQITAEFGIASDGVVDLIQDEMQAALDVLYSVRSFYVAVGGIEKNGFRKFVVPLLAEHHEIYAFEWIPRVEGTDRQAFEETGRLDYGKDFGIYDRTPSGEKFAAPERDFYYPLLLIQPYAGQNVQIPGLDYAARPGRMRAMKEALETGRPAMTDMLLLPRFKEAKVPYGTLIFLPAFKNSGSSGVQEAEGFFSAVFHVSEMIERAFQKNPVEGIALQVFSDTLEDDGQFIYEHSSGPEAFGSQKSAVEVRTKLEFCGRSWEIIFRPEKKFLANLHRNDAGFVAVLGVLLSIFGSFYLYYFESVKHRQILRRLSLLDELTSLYNRRGLTFLAEEQFRLSRRNKTTLALFIADLNYLKMINDRFGHQEGDRAIKAAAYLIKKSFRDSDIVSRVGGDEFAVVAINADPEKLKWILEKIQLAFAEYNKDKIHPYVLNVSVGFAYAGPEENKDLETLLDEADKALYEHKIFKPPFEVNS